MSVNRNANIIKAIQQEPRGVVRYAIPATVYLVGAGGWGGDTDNIDAAGGGGGGGAVISSSIFLTPNITHNIFAGDAVTGSDGQESYFYGWDGNSYNRPVTMSAQGGRQGQDTSGRQGGDGGNSGSGSIVFPEGVIATFPAYLGGSGVSTDPDLQAGGGGAGSTQNGQDATISPPAFGGDGGTGTTIMPVIVGAGGGGGGGANTNAGGTPGSDAGDSPYGGGGHGANSLGTGSAATPGCVIITFLPEYNYDITASNASTGTDAGKTYYFFENGIGSFRFTRPYPYAPEP